MHSIGGIESYADTLFAFSRYRSKLDDWDYIRQNTTTKKEASYNAYECRYYHEDGNGYDEYLAQGYFYSTRQFQEEERIIRQTVSLNENPLGETSEEYLRKIISFCKKENIPITLFVSPMDDLHLISTEGYDYYINQIQGIADEYQVDFYDFNLTKEEFLPIWEEKYFRDGGHLNGAGSNIFTPFFHEVVSGQKKDSQKYFYTSYEEKLKEMSPAIYGLYYYDPPVTEENPEPSRKYFVASNRSEGMEYRVSVKPDDGETYTVQGFSEETSFTLPLGQHGVCIVACRALDGDGAII